MQRLIYLLSALLILGSVALFATACGSDDDNKGSTDTAGSTSGDSSGATSGDTSDATSGDTSGSTSGDTSGSLSPSAYYDGPESAALGASGNQAMCATCHSNDGSSISFSGSTMKDIAYHTSFKGGAAPTLLDATNACVTGWMGGVALTSTDASWLALEAYFKSISDASVTTPNTIAPEVLADEAAYEAAYAGGDVTAGATGYATFCAKCHGLGLVVGGEASDTIDELKTQTIGRIAQQARTSGPPPSGTADATDSTPGPMPFFEPSELSEAELRDIIAYIKAQ
jgi:mono/diheme cytochrome c family protein